MVVCAKIQHLFVCLSKFKICLQFHEILHMLVFCSNQHMFVVLNMFHTYLCRSLICSTHAYKRGCIFILLSYGNEIFMEVRFYEQRWLLAACTLTTVMLAVQSTISCVYLSGRVIQSKKVFHEMLPEFFLSLEVILQPLISIKPTLFVELEYARTTPLIC